MPERLHFWRRNRKTWVALKMSGALLYRHSGNSYGRKGKIEKASEGKGEKKEQREGSVRQEFLPVLPSLSSKTEKRVVQEEPHKPFAVCKGF